MNLTTEFRRAQSYADRGNYPTALGILERAVAQHLGKVAECSWCGMPNREDGKYCPDCAGKVARLEAAETPS